MEFSLEATSTMIGEKTAMAFTIEVEEMIEKHWTKQEESLSNEHKELKSTLMKFKDNELGRPETGVNHDRENRLDIIQKNYCYTKK